MQDVSTLSAIAPSAAQATKALLPMLVIGSVLIATFAFIAVDWLQDGGCPRRRYPCGRSGARDGLCSKVTGRT